MTENSFFLNLPDNFYTYTGEILFYREKAVAGNMVVAVQSIE